MWKEILITALIGTFVAVGLGVWMETKDWVGHFGKSIEIHSFPFIASATLLGVVWIIRSTLGFLRSNDAAPMGRDDYSHLSQICLEDSEYSRWDRITRWTIAILFVTGGYAFQVAPGANETFKVSFITFWIPLFLYLIGGAYAVDVIAICLGLAVVAGLLWGISVLPTSLAIVAGAGVIAYAIYKRRK